MESIIASERECFVCGSMRDLHRHHIFYGTSNRAQSEKYGCWVYLCAYHHNMSDYGVHFNKTLDITLKRLAQKQWQARYGNRDKFIEVFGKSYL